MLIICPECQKNVSDQAASCPNCGYPINSAKKPRNRKKKRLPNGFGQISYINQNIRNPYRAMVTVGKDSNGKPICKLLKPQAFFKTYNEAYSALVEYNKNPYDLSPSITVEELYAKWYEAHTAKYNSASGLRTLSSTWRHCKDLYKFEVKELKVRHIKACMESVESPNIRARIKSMFNLMLDYAVEYDIVDKNCARTFNTSKDITEEIENSRKEHIAFSNNEMTILWKNAELPVVKLILIQCYTGFRPKELCTLKTENVDLEQNIIVGGMKTKAGTNRTVPIHPNIREFVDFFVKKESCMLFSGFTDGEFTYDVYRRRFEKAILELNLNPEHRCHDPRKTFVTMAKKYNVDEYAIKRIVGHSIGDLTEKIYTERDTEWLMNEMKKIKVDVYLTEKL